MSMGKGEEMPQALMEAKFVDTLPTGPEYFYEPKWDGFRCLVKKRGHEISLQSKAGKPLGRYFPEMGEAIAKIPLRSVTLDGELVIPWGNTLSFEKLLLRLHPAASRVKKLASETPAALVVFDILEREGKELQALAMEARRRELEDAFAKKWLRNPLFLSPKTTDPKVALKWLSQTGSSLDGVMAKRKGLPYCAGTRKGMAKLKLIRTADCVVGGYRYGKDGKKVGSLLLGLYDPEGNLHHVGHTSAIKEDEKRVLTQKLEGCRGGVGFNGRGPGGPSRWSREKSSQWERLRPEFVVEVSFDHVTGEHFRHGTRLIRWRPDKRPDQCGMEQWEAVKANFEKLLALGG